MNYQYLRLDLKKVAKEKRYSIYLIKWADRDAALFGKNNVPWPDIPKIGNFRSIGMGIGGRGGPGE